MQICDLCLVLLACVVSRDKDSYATFNVPIVAVMLILIYRLSASCLKTTLPNNALPASV